jgi:hypothetical protein
MLAWTKLKLLTASSTYQHNSCHSLGFNVYSSSNHTNCNYLRTQIHKLSMSFKFEHQKLLLKLCRTSTNTFNKNHISGWRLQPFPKPKLICCRFLFFLDFPLGSVSANSLVRTVRQEAELAQYVHRCQKMFRHCFTNVLVPHLVHPGLVHWRLYRQHFQ